MSSAPHPPGPDPEAPARADGERSHYSITQCAARLGVSRMSVWRWIRAGDLPVVRLGHRTARIRHADLERFLSEREAGPAPRPAWGDLGPAAHVVQFYEADAALVEAVGEYIGAGLRAGAVGIAIATGPHRAGLEARLRAAGLDPDAARARGDYVALDAAETLARIMVDGAPEAGRFAEAVGAVVARAAEGGRPVRAFGELVALLAARGDHAGALRLEALWNDLQQTHAFALLCGYPLAALGGEAFAAVLGDVCAAHARVVPAESYPARAGADARRRAAAALQQQAASLAAGAAARRRAEERLGRSERELRDFVENATEGLHWVGPDGRILWANRAELELLGYAAEEYVGRPVAEFHADPDVAADILRRLAGGQELHNHEARLRAKDGAIKHVLINSNVYREDGRFVHTRCFTRDVTERERAEREREALLARERAARAEAEAALRLRDEFLAVAAHELKTPLTSLKGQAQLARRRLERAGRLEPEAGAAALRAIERQADTLDRLLGHLLDVSRLEAGRLALARQATDLVALVEQVLADARARAAGRVITLAAPPLLEAEVDPLRLEQVLANLLSNALKYSPAGGPIEVALADPAPAAGGAAVALSVRDHGPGIPPEKRARIFERFYQAHDDGFQSGLGLGLYVSRQIVELHGGELSVEFPPDGGSRFVVRLPLPRETARPTRP